MSVITMHTHTNDRRRSAVFAIKINEDEEQ
jgi:hypothetical protein